jgi:serine/threonine-protein kinase
VIGIKLGPYEVLAKLGEGGMGEVYKARDTRLDRTVAIKVLPPHVLDDPAFRARFEREARTASSLEHPNICALYDVGREGTVEYLVMQYLDGVTLAQRVARGSMPIDEALRCAAEIAGALDRAHRAGVVHRDVKPGNVMLVKTGREVSAKLLDFGLAKGAAPAGLDVSRSAAATATSPLTGRGTIVGTLPYMSPEQLEGRELDARSDIFSFGAMLYEMVTGRRPFEANSEASLIAAILDRDPPPMASIAPLAPPALERLVRKCLAKDRERRWQSAADLADELSWIAQSSGAQQPAVARRRSKLTAYLLWALAAAIAAGLAIPIALTILKQRPAPPAGIARQLGIALPEGVTVRRGGGIAVSPDGQTIAFIASPPQLPAQLHVRRSNSSDVTVVNGTEGARNPFFSPDGQSIGYFVSTRLMKVSLRGGRPVLLASLPPVTRGGAWLPDDTIVVSPMQSSGLIRIDQEGKPTPLTTVDTAAGERAHLWPALLPGGGVLFAVLRGATSDVDAADIAVLDVATGERRVVYRGGAFPRYSPTGHLLFTRGGTLQAVPFDPASKTVSGAAVPIAEGVAIDPFFGGAHYAVAPDGAVLLFRGAFPRSQTSGVWVDASGTSAPVTGMTGSQPRQPRMSPDGTRVLYDAETSDGDDEIHVLDIARGTALRVSGDPRDDFGSVWTPDGRTVIWTALPPNRLPFLVMRPVDGSAPAEALLRDETTAQFVGSVSRSRVLAYTQASATGARDIYVVPLDGDRKPVPFVATAAIEFGPEFSPDGKWVAYVSRESGVTDIYVAPYPGPGGIRRVTSGGAVSPLWSRDGGTLYYQTGEGMFAVGVTGGSDIGFGAPRRLFTGTFVVDSREDGARNYDVSLDGKRFLMFVRQQVTVPPPSFQVLLNWAGDRR